MVSSYNRYSGSASVGLYKDIVDDLFYVTENETKLMDMAKSTEAKDGIFHYWEEIKYAAVTANNYSRADGASLSTTYTPPTKTERYNYVEESAVPFDVTKRQAESAKRRGIAGVRSLWGQAKTEAMVVLKDNVEWALLNGTKATGDASTASTMDGLTTMAESLGTTATEATASFPDVTGGEAEFKSLLNSMRAAGGMRGRKKMLIVSYTNRDSISTYWRGRADDVRDLAKDARIYADVQIYVSMYGPIAIEGHDMCSAVDMVIFDTEDVEIAWLYRTQTIDLGRTGLQENIAAVANACTLQYNRPARLGWLYIC